MRGGMVAMGPRKAAAELPELLAARARLSTGELRLKFAVLEDALRILLGGSRGPGTRQVWREARAWLLERDQDWPFSFERLCHALEIDAEALRSAVLGELDARAERPQPAHLRIVVPREHRGRS